MAHFLKHLVRKAGWKLLDFAGTYPSMSEAQTDLPPAPARVIVVEDDERLRRYALSALASADDIAVVGDAGSLATGLPLVDLAPDLALLDLGLPDGSGQTIIQAIREQVPHCRVLVFTVFEDRASVLGTLKAGGRRLYPERHIGGAVAGPRARHAGRRDAHQRARPATCSAWCVMNRRPPNPPMRRLRTCPRASVSCWNIWRAASAARKPLNTVPGVPG